MHRASDQLQIGYAFDGAVGQGLRRDLCQHIVQNLLPAIRKLSLNRCQTPLTQSFPGPSRAGREEKLRFAGAQELPA